MALLTLYLAENVYYSTACLWDSRRRSSYSSSLNEQYEQLRSPLAIALLGLTLVLAVLAVFCLEYTLHFVVLNLTIAERPLTASRDIEKSDKSAASVAKQPTGQITSTVANTLRHLHNTDGYGAYFRGFKVYAVYITLSTGLWLLLRQILNLLFGWATPETANVACTLLTEIISSRLHCAWTHSILHTPDQPTTVLELTPSEGEPWQPKSLVLPVRPESPLVLGRQTGTIGEEAAPSNGLFENLTISRKHASVWADKAGSVWIQDTESANGTRVNGTALGGAPHSLHDGDQLEMGTNIIASENIIVHAQISARVHLPSSPPATDSENCENWFHGRLTISYISRTDSKMLVFPALGASLATALIPSIYSILSGMLRDLLEPANSSDMSMWELAPAYLLYCVLVCVGLGAWVTVVVVPQVIERGRVEASLLCEGVEKTVVDIERSFGGLRVFADERRKCAARKYYLGQFGPARGLYDRDTYLRVVAVYANFLGRLVKVSIVAGIIVLADLVVILGGWWKVKGFIMGE
ncbi:hypothetical protein B0H66DRAFT_565658 [Apodospora peruviana]|uniref:FHA domain-containing protein n=1 Tax=Apodospora peruviana TaxID=516989 RepID=A0AAE0HZ93_9PEZI|nr:hypothetical protein B0H66DRAFT_565658 [Apodospora peruviana]